ncbi:MAG: hypothetical protein WCL04_05805 [Verrucomicrobiota bacterium]
MNPSPVKLPPSRTWRDLPQPIKPRAMSREGRRRRVLAALRVTGLAGLLLAAAWGGMEFFVTLKSNPARLVAPAGGATVRGLVMRTDGVLDTAWTEATLALPPKAGLMALDLAVLQRRLLASGQVGTAELTRRLPDRLAVTLHERIPVARVLAQAGDGEPRPLLVARDGVVFAGMGYAPETVARLPFLDGVRLKAVGSGFVPIEGMTAVAGLLDAAQSGVPELVRGFRVISLARFEADGVITVQSDDVGEVVFGVREEFARQFSRLDFALAATRRQLPVAPLRINLAIGGGQVLVARLVAEPQVERPALPRPADRAVVGTVKPLSAPGLSVNFPHAL